MKNCIMIQVVSLLVLSFCLLLPRVYGDAYLHSPRGSNDRNCERNVNRNNGNRLFDSQNNAKGGYACPRAVGGPDGPTENLPDQKMYYYVGEKVPIEWTNQHGAGDNKNLQSEIILQYACTDTLDATNKFKHATFDIVATPRDGIPINGNDAATKTIPNNPQDGYPNTDERRSFGMHENHDYYALCSTTQRNKGLFVADQKLKRHDARATRQNPNGNRNGLECPEERDYYPYWRPNPWRDIAVVTSDWSPEKEKYYQRESQANDGTDPNSGVRGMCVKGTSAEAEADYNKLKNSRNWHNNKDACVENGLHTWEKVQYAEGFTGKPSPLPLVVQGDYSRVNQLGNGASMHATKQNGMKEICTDHTTSAGSACTTPKIGTNTFVDTTTGRLFDANFGGNLQANYFPWTVPDTPNKHCTLRLRYNISTYDYPAWKNGNRYLDDTDDFTGDNGLTATSNCRGKTKKDGTPCTAHMFPAMTQDPYISVGPEENQLLSLALNTNQHSRTFQDRSYVFEIRERPSGYAGKRIVALSVRGKRGNIVQTYPAVEYDFVPNNLVVENLDYVHAQWTGSDYNPQRGCNNGEGGPPDCKGCPPFSQEQINAGNKNSRADRSNLVFTDAVGYNRPILAQATKTADLLLADLKSSAYVAETPFSAADAWKLAYIKQDDAGSPLLKANLKCLTQTELNAIKNKNRRENHPQNCAKLNAAVTPYFDGGLMKVERPSANKKRYSAMSTRNNNFSNRDQRLNMCIKTNAADCDPEGSGQLAKWKRKLPKVAPPTVAIKTEAGAEPVALAQGTMAPIEKDNDAIGDGEEEACEARVLEFLLSLGLGGLIALGVAMLAIGALSAVLIQRAYARHQRGAVKNKTSWLDEKPAARV